MRRESEKRYLNKLGNASISIGSTSITISMYLLVSTGFLSKFILNVIWYFLPSGLKVVPSILTNSPSTPSLELIYPITNTLFGGSGNGSNSFIPNFSVICSHITLS